MELKQLIQDEDAVSPVIGVILMVAITVILAAVIGTFVLGLGDQVQSSAPNANFNFEYNDGDDGFDTGTNDDITITHNGGQDVEASNVEIQVGSNIVSDTSGLSGGFSGTISTGSSATITESTTASNIENGKTVRVIWQSPSGGSSNTIGESTVPS